MPYSVLPILMGQVNSSESYLEAAAGASGPNVTDAFKLLADETRLAILLALWEAYDPLEDPNTVSFSDLYDRVAVRDSGNFSYHLDKLVDHFIEETPNGYQLRNSGLKIVQAVVAGTGLDERRLRPTDIPRSCYHCGAPVELSYKDERLYQICTACDGNIGPDSTEKTPVGTLVVYDDFNPAGLAYRTPEEVFVAGTIKYDRAVSLLVRGVCPECSGPVEESLHICESHEASPGTPCPTCGTSDEARVSYVCSVCKHGGSYPAWTAVYDHPEIVSFYHAHGFDMTFGLDDPEACGRLWNRLKKEQTLLSEEPIRIRVSVPFEDKTLHLTLDGDLEVIDVEHEVVLPDSEDCLKQLRHQRWPGGVTCPHCDAADTIRKGTTSKDARRYQCHNCGRTFNDLTGTIFAEHRLSLPEMFYIIRQMNDTELTHIARQLDRSYKSVLDFAHEVPLCVAATAEN